ncbi:hypothetical protein A3Q56_05407 [Intoshia linei]|uniref:PiggyBac transposable element-derived protein domain-containing protein n=1 Tax=Intoshia linei TaxID=1819745 RepID=A0A177AY10_9BILA|nr:hypothetical protein A3Q56_05407 [Intoshia linei]
MIMKEDFDTSSGSECDSEHLIESGAGGVDILDDLCNEYNTKRKTRRWPHCLFQGIFWL